MVTEDQVGVVSMEPRKRRASPHFLTGKAPIGAWHINHIQLDARKKWANGCG